MSPRSFIPMLAAAMLVTAAPAFAQGPQPAVEPAPPPAARAVAVERTRGGGRDAEHGAPARHEPTAEAQDVQPRSRVVVATSPSASTPAMEEQQGGRRNPRSGGGGGSRGGGATRGGGSPRTGSGSSGGSGDDGQRAGGQAVPRVGGPRPPRSGYVVPNYARRYYSGPNGLGYYYYDPWSWYTGYGFGYGWPGYYGSWGGYYGNYGGYGGYGYGGYGGAYGYGRYGGPYGWDIGGLRLKVRPKDAEVYVDGYYAGIVDDFDGMFQQLRLDDGGYRIEIRKPGLRPLTFDIRIQPGRTITYHGDLISTP